MPPPLPVQASANTRHVVDPQPVGPSTEGHGATGTVDTYTADPISPAKGRGTAFATEIAAAIAELGPRPRDAEPSPAQFERSEYLLRVSVPAKG